MRRLIGLLALLLLIIAGVAVVLTRDTTDSQPDGSTDVTAAVTTNVPDDPTSLATTDTTSAAASTPPTTESTPTTGLDTTDSTRPDDAEPVFVVSEVQFGEEGFIAIRNVGVVSGNLAGFALCNRPAYFQIPDVELDPLDIVWIAVGDGSALSAGAGGVAEIIPMNGALGVIDRADGEIGLYRSSAFDNPEAMITYVEWGAPGHGRSSVAVEAGLWEEGAFIEIPDDAFGIQSIAPPDRPAQSATEWVAGVGG